jgi:hypothetical protein
VQRQIDRPSGTSARSVGIWSCNKSRFIGLKFTRGSLTGDVFHIHAVVAFCTSRGGSVTAGLVIIIIVVKNNDLAKSLLQLIALCFIPPFLEFGVRCWLS